MFSYADLVRTEIAFEVGARFGVDFSEEEIAAWRSLGDVARSVVARAGGATTVGDVWPWVRALIAQGYGVSTDLTPEEPVFSDYDRMIGWFMAPPQPHSLGDRWFARERGGRFDGP